MILSPTSYVSPMKVSLLFFAIGIVLLLLQMTFLHLLPLGPIVPDFILVLCVYWGLHHPSVGAVLGAFMLGYSVDVVRDLASGRPFLEARAALRTRPRLADAQDA